jgi:hypothetical protein
MATWNDRVAYSPPSAYHGYPSRFRRFPQEIVDCLIDTGPGSPCGSLFVDEPGCRSRIGGRLLTVEWGQNRVDRHPLTPRGAGFGPTTAEKMMDVPRGIDIDVDGMSRMYLASWAGGGFRYSDPNVGYVVRLTPKGATTSRPSSTTAASSAAFRIWRTRAFRSCWNISPATAACCGKRRTRRSCGGGFAGAGGWVGEVGCGVG